MDISKRVRELSEAVILLEPTDLQALASVHSQFEEIESSASEAALPRIGEASRAAATLIEQIILDEVPDPNAALSVIVETVTIIQRTLREGRSADHVSFPKELGLAPVTPSIPASESPVPEPAEPVTPPPGAAATHADEELLSEFINRQNGALEEIEEIILSLEKSFDEARLDNLRGLIHTMKGEAGVLGLDELQRVCHALEDRLGPHVAKHMADVLLNVKDWLQHVLDACAGKRSAARPAEAILDVLEAAGRHEAAPDAPPTLPSSPTPSEKHPLPVERPVKSEAPDSPTLTTEILSGRESAAELVAAHAASLSLDGDVGLITDFISEAREHLDSADVHLLTLENAPDENEALNAVFRAFHTIKGVTGFLGLSEMESLSHEAENLLDRARKGQLTLDGRAMDVTFEAVDSLKQQVNRLSEALSTGAQLGRDPGLPTLLTRIGAVLSGQEPPEPAPSGPPVPVIKKDESPPANPENGSTAKASPSFSGAAKADGTIRPIKISEAVKVDAERLDGLVEMIGELVITESMVNQAAETMDASSPELARHLKQLGKITRELQEMGTSLRMIPVRPIFQKMARLARDLSRKTGKPLDFIMAGEDTELDKTVVDRIADPLVHLIRNAVDHGLEDSPAERRGAGKPETGRVDIRSYHKGGNIYIEIEDDGRGLDREMILDTARERGLVNNGDVLSDRDVFNLIFEPGFSTAQTVSDVSGRGVGMDVVKRNILALQGQIDIQSERGKGTVFAIRLPLTLAIIDGMIVGIGPHRYIIPTLSIVQSVQPQTQDLSTVLNMGEMAAFQGRHVPLFRLADLFQVADAKQDPSEGIVVVVEDGDDLAGLFVDELIGQQQIVIKSLGEFFRGVTGVAGGAIMSDGRVGLILDVGALVRLAN